MDHDEDLQALTSQPQADAARVFRKVSRAALLLAVLFCSSEFAKAAPDLIVNRKRLAKSVEVRTQTFSASSCAVKEGCVGGSGTRTLLVFDAGMINIGASDLVIGKPEKRPDLYHYSDCHGHYHMSDFSSYKLLKRNGTVVVNKRKQGFCLRDDKRYLNSARANPRFDCDTQGLSRGWQDIYGKDLDCQWIDITGVRPGRYYLQVVVNPKRVFSESNYGNNRVMVPVTIP